MTDFCPFMYKLHIKGKISVCAQNSYEITNK